MPKLLKIELPFAGFYESIHDSQIDYGLDSAFQDDHGDVPSAIANIIWQTNIDHAAIRQDYAEAYTYNFGQAYGLTIAYDGLQSPKFYNFSTDRIFATIPLSEMRKVRQAVERHAEWPKYVADRYTSYDGFMSFYSNDTANTEWTRPVLDECQYRTILEFWLEYVYPGRNDEAELIVEEPYNLPAMNTAIGRIHDAITARLEALRAELRAEAISYGELAELQALGPYIESGDVELAEAAGIPEEEFNNRNHKD